MTLDDALDRALAETPLVAIIRGVKPDEVIAVAEALYAGGVRVVEVPLNSPDPFDSIGRLRDLADRIVYGAGTVLDPADVEKVKAAGGGIIVSPNTNPIVIRRAVELNLSPMPGFATASEAFTAIEAGATRLKLFPAGPLGASYLKALMAILPKSASVYPVGGVKPGAMVDWWAAGAKGFGLGGELYAPGMAPDEIRRRAEAAVGAVQALSVTPR